MKQQAVLFILFGCVLAISACRKCERCYPLHGHFRCDKRVDTVYLFFGHIKGADDSIAKYQNLGYNCDTTFWGYGNYTDYCSKDGLARAEDLGDSCV